MSTKPKSRKSKSAKPTSGKPTSTKPTSGKSTNGTTAAKRIQMELINIEQSGELAENGISVETVDGSLLHLKGVVTGPVDTPYENGKFQFYVEVPIKYPFQPFKIIFTTKIWHPNINSKTGDIYLNILQDKEWLPCMGLKEALISVKYLLCDAEPDDALDALVASQFQKDQDLFKRTAKDWAQKFAGAPRFNPEFEKKVKIIQNTVDEERAITALSSSLAALNLED